MNQCVPIIVNPQSDSVQPIRRAVELYARDGLCTLRECGSPGQLQEALQQCREDENTRIIVAGGDGTVRRTMNQLGDELETVELAILPAGTGNDFARALDLPVNDYELALRMALSGDVSTVDVMTIEDVELPIVANSVTAGATAPHRASDQSKSQWGPVAYWAAAVSALQDLPARHVRIRYDGDALEAEVYGFAICNGRTVGGGFPVADDALLDDGRCDLVLLPVQPLSQALRAAFDTLLRLDSGEDRLIRRKAASIEIESDEPLELSIDGDTEQRTHLALRTGERRCHVVHGPNAALASTARSDQSPTSD